MKNFNFFKTVVWYSCMLSGYSLFGQQVIVEYTQKLPGSPVKTQSLFNNSEYTQISDENNQKVYIANNSISPNSNLNGNVETEEEDVNDVTLTIELVFDPLVYTAPYFIQVFDETGFRGFAEIAGENIYTISVPPGTYDAVARFSGSLNYISSIDFFVIRELQQVNGDTTIEMDVAESTHHISTKMYNEVGELLMPAIFNPEDQTTTGGNANILINRGLHFVSANSTFFVASYSMEYLYLGADDLPWNFYINDISNRYAVVQNMVGVGNEGSNYFFDPETINGISGSIAIENNPDDYILHKEKLKPSPLAESETPVYGFQTITTMSNNYSNGWKVWNIINENPEEGFTACLNNPISGDIADLLVFPAVTEIVTDDLGVIFTGGNAVVKGNNGDVLYGSGNTFIDPTSNFSGIDFFGIEGENFKILPFHPKFSFSAIDNPGVVQGDNTPISTIPTIIVPPAGISFIETQYKGRYAERRQIDVFSAVVEAKQDGNTFFYGNYLDFLQLNPIPATGVWDIMFTNTNVEVDGLESKNITRVTYNSSLGDAAPTLQMLQFRDTSGKVTDRFASAAEGTVRLAAGDFQYNLDYGIYDYNEGNNVEFYYSLYDQNNWTELELTKYPEYFFMPAFGDYYEASLEGIQNTQADTWYDVRIVCTDSAGNKQEQIVSPAFKINDTMGIEENNNKINFVVYPNPFSGELNVQLPENLKGSYIFKVTDLSGKTVYSENRNTGLPKSFVWNGSSLPSGIYVCSIISDNQTVARKVIKK